MIDQWMQLSNITPCVNCGYCCKKSTCPLGMRFDSPPTNCSFLGGDKPGEYYCRFITENIVPDARTMVAIGEGCCESLNTDRKIALKNMSLAKCSPIAKPISIIKKIS